MVRLLLAACVMIQAALGPSLCCCTVSAAPKKPAAPRATAKRSCCHHQDDAQLPPPRNESQTPSKPCPCHQHPSNDFATATAAAPADPFSVLERAASWLPAVLADATVDTAAGSLADPFGGGTLPFLTAQDLLRTHHVLRC
jgi:hypothetical protein